MKDYMNAAEQENFLMAWGAQSAIAIVIDEAQGHVPKEVLADLKRARSFTERALRNWIKPKNLKTKTIVTKKAAGVSIGLLNDAKKKAEHVAFLKHMQKVREEAYREDPDHVLDLAEITMAVVCKKCSGKPKAKCPVYQAFQGLDIEPWDKNHPSCEYAGAGITQKGVSA
ncbi:DUF5651 domain-containing protein [Alicyclobacillus fastidiosus]|uniref:DUF5651 domain-containing protein n=1 Tax=Alicyclobacillus fastidiosus TaxID=392011 RepID=A0ABV5ALK1_9BACL|nr:DUF5651 domain-containing protein [Alicyclobacillus fastidiosus]WEH08505.1 DUF5651 domain-containing protein [Alicyclobacillus fastidiosus]